MKPVGYRADIDGLRSLAIVPVVLYHAELGFSGGYVGVDVFFVISGYLITGILLREIDGGGLSIARFYERRIRRLFPAFFVVAAFTTAASAWLMIPGHLEEAARGGLASLYFLSNFYFYTSAHYFGPSSDLLPFLHTWSLAVEEQFYFVFPAALWLWTRIAPRWTLWIVFLGVSAVSLFLAVRWSVGSEAAFYLPHARAWELMLGALLALAGEARLPRAAREVLGAAGIAGIAFPVFFYTSHTPFPGWTALPPCLGAAALIVAGSGGGSVVSRGLSLAPFVFVGRISYSLYLWHWPVLVFAKYGLLDPFTWQQGLVCTALSVGLAAATWRWIEEPARRGRMAPSPVHVFALGGVATAVTAGVFGLLLATGGLPNRMSAELKASLPFSDSSWLRMAECDESFPQKHRLGDLCRFGSSDAAPSFILLGDSHAGVLAPGIKAAAAASGRDGWRFFRPGLLPYPGIWFQRDGRPRQDVAAVLDFIEARPEIDTLIVTSYWSWIVSGENALAGPYNQVAGSIDVSDSPDNGALLAHGLLSLADRFPDRRIVVLDDVPSGLGMSVQSLRAAALARGDRRRPGVSRAAAEMEAATYAPALSGAAAARENMVYAEVLTASICVEADWCPMIAPDGVSLYRDATHLSRPGSERLGEPLRRALGW